MKTGIVLEFVCVTILLLGCVQQEYPIEQQDMPFEQQDMPSGEQVVEQPLEDIAPEPMTERNTENTKPEPTSRTTTLTLVQDDPVMLEIGDREYTFALLGVTDGAASLNLHGIPLTLLDATPDGFTRPRDSWVDLTVSRGWTGVRKNVIVGQEVPFSVGDVTVNVKLAFVGISNGVPVASLVVDGQTANLAERGEEYFDDGTYVRVRHIYFNDPRETEMVDTARIVITEESLYHS